MGRSELAQAPPWPCPPVAEVAWSREVKDCVRARRGHRKACSLAQPPLSRCLFLERRPGRVEVALQPDRREAKLSFSGRGHSGLGTTVGGRVWPCSWTSVSQWVLRFLWTPEMRVSSHGPKPHKNNDHDPKEGQGPGPCL